jgi:hypothetical protein
LERILEGKGISNIVITPNVVGDIERAQKIYEGIIKEEVNILKEALNYTIMSQMPEVDRLRYFVNAGIEIIKELGYSRGIIRQMVVGINESFGEGTAEVVRLEDNESVIRIAKGGVIRNRKRR